MEKKKSYDSRLYHISKNISSKKNSGLSYDSAESIHNALHPFYKQLTGDYIPQKSSIEYVMPVIDLKTASDSQLEKLCEFYLDYMRNPDADSSVKKVKSNLTKINLTADTQLIDKSMKYAEEECNKDIKHGENNVEFYKTLYNYYQQTARSNIKNWQGQYIELYNQLSSTISLKQLLMFRCSALNKIFTLDDIKKIENDFSIWTNHYRTQLYIDLSCWVILQTVTNFLTQKKYNNSIESVKRLCKEIDNISREVVPVKCSNNIFMTYSEFLLFTVFRTHFLEDIKHLKTLTKNSIDTQNPQPEYSLITDDGKIKTLSPSERYNVYLEGDTKDRRSFNRNLEKCMRFIELFNEQSGRNLKLNDITLKAVYRQLILEKTLQGKQQSQTIINKFLRNNGFKDLKEYYFINEKINLGMYREYGLLEEFQLKNTFHEKLYTHINILLTRLNPSDIFQATQEDFDKLYLLLDDVLPENRQSVAVESIEEFLSTMEFDFLGEAKPENNK